MAEDQNQEVEQTENGEEGSGGSSKLIIIIALAVVLIGGAAAAAFFLMGGEEEPAKKGAETEVAAEAAEAEVVDPNAPPKPSAYFFEMPEILVNLASSGSATRYLKLKLNLEVATEQDLAKLEVLLPRVVDDFQLYLRQLRVEDLNGSSGIYRLKEDLLLRANQAVAPLQVKNVLFKEILVQ